MGTFPAIRQYGLPFLIALVVSFSNLAVNAGSKKPSSAEENEPSNGGGSHLSSQIKADKYSSAAGGSSSDKYSAAYPSSAMSYYSAYGYPGAGGYPYYANGAGGSGDNGKQSYYNPYATEPVYDRAAKDFSPRTSHNMPMAMAASSNFGNFGTSSNSHAQSKEVTGPEFGGMPSASGGQGWGGQGWGKGGGGGGHGGWGGGWGGWHGGHKKGNQESALGAIATIALLSLLANVLRQLTATTTTTTMMMMMGGRKRRDVIGDDVTDDRSDVNDESYHHVARISMMVLPSLNVIAHAREGRVPLECTHREVCVANSVLVKELGLLGRSAGTVISSAITKLLKEVKNSGPIEKHLDKASVAGRNGDDCTIVYPLCKALGKYTRSPLPFLVSPQQISAITNPKQVQTSRITSPFNYS